MTVAFVFYDLVLSSNINLNYVCTSQALLYMCDNYASRGMLPQGDNVCFYVYII